jgi:hypothetical protein
MSFIIYPQADNKLAVLIPAPCNLTIEEIAAKGVPKGVTYSIVEDLSHLDDDYFDGYIYQDGKAVEDMERCKEIHLEKFREARKPLLEKLDVDYLRAQESGTKAQKDAIIARKKALRDVTLTELPDTLDELKATWPEILNS